MNKKQRRHSGWIVPSSTMKLPKKYIIDNCLEPEVYWDDWMEYRDGQRNWTRDRSKIKHKWIDDYWDEIMERISKDNCKLKLLLKRRKAMKWNMNMTR